MLHSFSTRHLSALETLAILLPILHRRELNQDRENKGLTFRELQHIQVNRRPGKDKRVLTPVQIYSYTSSRSAFFKFAP